MVGLGELLARLERRRQLLAAEGLFAAELKRPLPFLPRLRRPGHRARARPPSATCSTTPGAAGRRCAFEVAYAAMQGPARRAEVIEAVERLDRDPARRRDRGRPRRRLGRGPAAVLRRGPDPGRPRGPHAGRLGDRPRARLARCSTWSPTSAPRRRPTPPSWSSPTCRGAAAASRPPATGSARRVTGFLAREQAGLDACARGRCSPTRGPWSTARADEVDAAARPGPPLPAPRARPGRRRHRPPARPGAGAVAAGDAAARLRRAPGRRRPRRHLRRRRRAAGAAVASASPTAASTPPPTKVEPEETDD